MANDYLTKFQDEFNTSKDFTKAIVAAFSLYLNTQSEELATKGPLKKALNEFVAHAKSAEIGTTLLSYNFQLKLPHPLQELVDVAKLIEMRAMQIPSPLVAQCENTAAAEGHTPKSIFEMSAALERALVDKKVPYYHEAEVQAKRREWTELLYEKFADLILMSKDVKGLDALFAENFSEALVEDLPQLNELRGEMYAQIEYLEDKFFSKFYKLEKLSDRYDFVNDFYLDQKANGFVTTELKATLSKLFFQIIANAYAPAEVAKFKLMCDRQAGVDEIYQKLKGLLKEKEWKEHEGSDLESELENRLSSDEERAKDWQEVSFRMTGKKLPAFQVHCFKYAGDPNKDPKSILVTLPSPVKKVKVKVQSCPSVVKPIDLPKDQPDPKAKINLFADEKLDLSDEEDQDLKHQAKKGKRL